MKNSNLLFITFLWLSVHSQAQIANNFAGDVGIENHPDVIFTEMFEEDTITTMAANWTYASNVAANIVFDASVPSSSMGSQSLRLITINDADTTSVVPNESTAIYKRLQQGIDDSVFVRFYIKYDNATRYHHSGFWMGGKNPPSNYPGNQSGVLPLGNKAFHIGTEVRGTVLSPSNTSVYGFYNYWMGMHQSSQLNQSTGQNYYWGNQFYNSTPSDDIDMTSWNCIEVMVKLNNPVSANNGELALWVNGVQVSHYGPQFPNGTWNYNNFTEGVGNPFEGFQWRNNDSLKFNYLWLTSYVTQNINHMGNVYYDHIVMAKNYIGPIHNNLVDIAEPKRSFTLYPNPTAGMLSFSETLQEVSIFNLIGETILRMSEPVKSIPTIALSDGIYFLKSNEGTVKFAVRK